MLDLRSMAAALGGVISKDQVLAPGPGHSQADRSLSVKLDPNAPDGFLVHSFASDDPIACKDFVRQKCGLSKSNGIRRARRSSEEVENLLAAAVASQQQEGPRGSLTATYRYTDASGGLLYQVLRYDNPKTFKQRRPDGKGWIWTLRDVKRVLYALPGLTKYPDATVFVTEGERDSDSLIALEQCATTVASGKWDGVDLEPLRGRECIVLQDNDDAGHKKALDAAKHLHGIAATVRIVLLPDLPDKGDVSDWLNAGHSVDDLIEVCFAAPLWEPIAGVAEQGADDNIEPAAISVAPDAASDRPPPALAPPPPPLPLPFISITAWHDQPIPEREWCVRDRVPMRNVTLFSGEGAIGKSIIVLQLSVAHVLGRDWLGSMPELGPVLVVACEDDASELHRRLSCILGHYGASFADLKDLHLISLAGQDALMATPNRLGLIQPTKLFERLRDAARDIRPKLIVLDNSADVFGGSENDRAQVRHFIGVLRGLAITAGSGVLLTSHPSLTGISSGSGISGSTAWNASVRSRLFMKRAVTEKGDEPDPNLRVIEIMKSNYGPIGETINVRWLNGLFVPVAKMGSLDKLAADHTSDELFLQLLDRFEKQGRNVSHKKAANNYAPAEFNIDPDGKGKRKELADAMARLFTANKIKAEPYGRASKYSSRLVRC